MNKRKQIVTYLLTDFFMSSIAWLLFNWVRFDELASFLGFQSINEYLTYSKVLRGQFFLPFFWMALFALSGYYNAPFGKSRLNELFITLFSVTLGCLIIFFVVILDDLPPSFDVYYTLFFTLVGLQFGLIYMGRLSITLRGLRKIKTKEWALRSLIIGAGKNAKRIAHDLSNLGYEVVVLLPEAEIERLPALMNATKVDELIIALDTVDSEAELKILYSLYVYKKPIKILAERSKLLSNVRIHTIRGIPLVDVTASNLSEGEANIKWVLDKLVSILFLLLFSPVFAYLAWQVKRSSKGPIFYRQERIGYRGKPYYIYKFRTMTVHAEDCAPLLASDNDKRITPFGKIMRKYRLDELPQFWNVLKGDMALVGPRPERKFFIDQIVTRAPYYYLLHNVKPGITSLGMVKYGYADNVDKMLERLDYDMLYYENMSLTLDITILFYTVITIVTGKGI